MHPKQTLRCPNQTKPSLLCRIDGLPWLHMPKQQVLADIPGQAVKIIRSMIPRADTKDAVQLLERTLLSLRQTEIGKDPAEEVPGGVVAKSARGGEGADERGPGERDDEVEAPGRGGCKRHAVLADVEREGFGGVGEGYGALAGGVDDHEEVDSCCDTGDAAGAFGNEEGEAGDEEHDALVWILSQLFLSRAFCGAGGSELIK